jgi:hypothetical protein
MSLDVVKPSSGGKELQQAVDCPLQIRWAAGQETSVELTAHAAGQGHHPALRGIEHAGCDVGLGRGAAVVASARGDLRLAARCGDDLGVDARRRRPDAVLRHLLGRSALPQFGGDTRQRFERCTTMSRRSRGSSKRLRGVAYAPSTRGALHDRREQAELRRDLYEAHRLIDGLHRRFAETLPPRQAGRRGQAQSSKHLPNGALAARR